MYIYLFITWTWKTNLTIIIVEKNKQTNNYFRTKLQDLTSTILKELLYKLLVC